MTLIRSRALLAAGAITVSLLMTGCGPSGGPGAGAAVSSDSPAAGVSASLSAADKDAAAELIKRSITAYEKADKDALLATLTGDALSEVQKLSPESIAADSRRQQQERGSFQALEVTDVLVTTAEIRSIRTRVKYSLNIEGAVTIFELKPADGQWKIASLESIRQY